MPQRNHGGILNVFRQKHGGEILVNHAGPVERTLHSGSAADLLDVQALGLVVVLMLDAAGRIGRRTRLVSEAGRPQRKSGDLTSFGKDRSLDVNQVSVIEAESLADRHVCIRIFEADLRRGIQLA